MYRTRNATGEKTMASWHVTGEYCEACSCDFLCPCLPSNLTAPPTNGECRAALAFHITEGRYDGQALDGLSFVVALHTPGVMADGNWTVGLIVDQRASPAQKDAIA